MIANSKIAVFPDPVGADTTIDTSVTKQNKFVTLTILRPHKEISWIDCLYFSLKFLLFCCLAHFSIYPSSHQAIIPTRMLVLVSLITAKCCGLDDRPEEAGVK
jgi:hypothetical protein